MVMTIGGGDLVFSRIRLIQFGGGRLIDYLGFDLRGSRESRTYGGRVGSDTGDRVTGLPLFKRTSLSVDRWPSLYVSSFSLMREPHYTPYSRTFVHPLLRPVHNKGLLSMTTLSASVTLDSFRCSRWLLFVVCQKVSIYNYVLVRSGL